MNRQRRAIIILIWMGLAFILSGCRPDQNEMFIQGSWFYNDMHIQETIGESFQESSWTFDRGAFTYYACCFMTAEMRGRYEILKSDGDAITIELFNLNGGFNTERTDVKIKINRSDDMLHIQGTGPYIRMEP